MTEASCTLSLGAELPSERDAQLVRDLERDLSLAGMDAQVVNASPDQGAKGDPITVGVVTLALVTSGSLKALIECLKAYLLREPSLVIKVKRPDGMQVELNSRNINSSEINGVLKAITSAS